MSRFDQLWSEGLALLISTVFLVALFVWGADAIRFVSIGLSITTSFLLAHYTRFVFRIPRPGAQWDKE